jgi:hypothetical protein
MKRIIIVSIVLYICMDLIGQDNIRLLNSDLYKRPGVIFCKDFEIPVLLPTNNIRFTPTDNEIIEGENALLKILRDKKEFNLVKLSKYRKYRRQYFGYIVEENKLIVIQLAFIDNKHIERKYFSSWQYDYFLGLGDFYYKRIRFLEYNLTSKQFYVFK